LLDAAANVAVVALPLSDLDPENHPHRVDLGLYAFKALVMRDALRRHTCVMWLDAGMELRRNISEIRKDLDRDGYWFSANAYFSPKIFPDLHFTPLAAIQALGNNVSIDYFLPYRYHEICSTFLGMARTGPAFRFVLDPWVECSLNKACLLPLPHLTRANYLHDQTILNMLVYRKGGFAEYLRSSRPTRRASIAMPCSTVDEWVKRHGMHQYRHGMHRYDCHSLCPHARVSPLLAACL
jgi:hypothetical protein